MTRRVLTAAFAVLILAPAPGSGQMMPELDATTSRARVRISPFVGYLPGVERSESWLYSNGAERTSAEVETELGSAVAAGLNLEYRLSPKFGVTALGAYGSRDETVFTVTETGDAVLVDGSRVFIGRLGGAFYLHEAVDELTVRRLDASVFAGAVVMHDRPRNDVGTQEFLDNGTHFGANVGLNAEIPFGSDRFALQVGIEDNVMFWREGPLARLAWEYFNRPGTSSAQTTASADVSHVWLLRAGLSFRFH